MPLYRIEIVRDVGGRHEKTVSYKECANERAAWKYLIDLMYIEVPVFKLIRSIYMYGPDGKVLYSHT